MARSTAIRERPTARTRGLRSLVRALDEIVDAGLSPASEAAWAGRLLPSALADDALLEPRHQEPWDDRYRPHLVHVHPEGRYSIVALVWKPGQATPIHDHRCWCVVGVWRGVEQETNYELFGSRSGPYLMQRRTGLTRRGDVSVLVPPEEDIHRVENAGDDVAISIHVYGDDIGVHGSSVNRVFEDGLVRPSHPADVGRISWRALDAPRA